MYLIEKSDDIIEFKVSKPIICRRAFNVASNARYVANRSGVEPERSWFVQPNGCTRGSMRRDPGMYKRAGCPKLIMIFHQVPRAGIATPMEIIQNVRPKKPKFRWLWL